MIIDARETVARIVDPAAWSTPEENDQYDHPHGVAAFWDDRKKAQQRSLAKASTIMVIIGRAVAGPESVRCPSCGAPVGSPCRTIQGPMPPCPKRITAALEASVDETVDNSPVEAVSPGITDGVGRAAALAAYDRVEEYIAMLLNALAPFSNAAETCDVVNADKVDGARARPFKYVATPHFQEAFSAYSMKLDPEDGELIRDALRFTTPAPVLTDGLEEIGRLTKLQSGGGLEQVYGHAYGEKLRSDLRVLLAAQGHMAEDAQHSVSDETIASAVGDIPDQTIRAIAESKDVATCRFRIAQALAAEHAGDAMIREAVDEAKTYMRHDRDCTARKGANYDDTHCDCGMVKARAALTPKGGAGDE